MKPLRLLIAFALMVGGWSSSCSSNEQAARSGGAPGPSVGTGGRGGSTAEDITPKAGTSGAGIELHRLCGEAPECHPEDEAACTGFVPNTGGSAGTGGASAGGAAPWSSAGEAGSSSGNAGEGGGAASEGGSAGLHQGGAAGASGASGQAGASGFPNESGGSSGEPRAGSPSVEPPVINGPPPASGFACRVQRTPSGAPRASCGPSGGGAVDAPCSSSSDCSAGTACVGSSALARCRPYCCGLPESCGPSAYCAELPARDPGGPSEGLLVPVCLAADNCDLSEPVPCPQGRTCTCTQDTACSIVKPDGTTACVAPGSGRQGQSCPCAAGHLCSRGSNVCVKLCKPEDLSPSCPEGTLCQLAAGVPQPFGLCVGGTPYSAGGSSGSSAQ
jgi:hypothetical protein